MNDNAPPISNRLMWSIRLRVVLGIQCGSYLSLGAQYLASDAAIAAVWLGCAAVWAALAFSRPVDS